ncbi:L-serine ammonia-lyase, iron-sulfur-dependent, subunit alpha [Streptomyces sp. NPDC012403]
MSGLRSTGEAELPGDQHVQRRRKGFGRPGLPPCPPPARHPVRLVVTGSMRGCRPSPARRSSHGGTLLAQGSVQPGGALEQVENAAGIGVEHNLCLACGPVGGLVRTPLIGRNGTVAAARTAMRTTGPTRCSSARSSRP